MKPPAITVTDHALLRYLERVKGVDVEAARAEIAGIVAPALGAGSTKFSSGNFTFALNPVTRTVVTVVNGKSPSAAREKGYRLQGRKPLTKGGRPEARR